MFIKIVILLFAISFALEFYLHKRVIKGQSKARKTLYYTLTGLCLIPYAILLILSQWIDNESALLSAFSSSIFILFLLHFFWKLPLTLALLCSSERRRWPLRVAAGFSLLATVLIAYGTLWERHQVRTTHLTLHYDNLPEGANGLKIVQVTDLHIGRQQATKRLLERVQREVMSHHPDLVVDCGDMVNAKYNELDSATMAILGRITAPLGVYTVLGNHDRGDYITDTLTLPREEHRALLVERQREMGWQNITDQSVALPVGGDSLYLTAINYPSLVEKGAHGGTVTEDYSSHFAPLPEGAFNIVLAHTPTMWESIVAATEAELTLSGHVHAMQLRLPVGPRGWSPAALVYNYWSGLYEKGDSRLFVSDGIGGGIPFRIGAKPQVVVITLRRG